MRIRILATAVTSSGCYLRGLRRTPAYRIMARLALGWNAPRQPALGMVLSGEVDALGSDVRSFEVGHRVFGFNRHRFRRYPQYACWPADGLQIRGRRAGQPRIMFSEATDVSIFNEYWGLKVEFSALYILADRIFDIVDQHHALPEGNSRQVEPQLLDHCVLFRL